MILFLRFGCGVLVGMFVSLLLVIGVELFSAVAYPTPPDFDGSMEEMSAHVSRYPFWVLSLAGLAWGFTAFVGSWVAHRVGGRAAAIAVGLTLVAGTVFNILMLPYPLWFEFAIVPMVLSGAVLAICRRERAAAAEAPPPGGGS